MKSVICFFFCSILISCAQTPTDYPAHWWAPVSDENAPSWEILPQMAGPGEVILSKRNELGILSNFAATPFIYRGKEYASVEGFWQMMKYAESQSDPRAIFKLAHSREEVAQMVAFEAKAAGDAASAEMKKHKIDWVTFEGEKMVYCSTTPAFHYRLIKDAMWEKVMQNPQVKKTLLATGDLILRPDHLGGSCQAPEWKYHELWMEIRSELQR